jgi:hypothetical protein
MTWLRSPTGTTAQRGCSGSDYRRMKFEDIFLSFLAVAISLCVGCRKQTDATAANLNERASVNATASKLETGPSTQNQSSPTPGRPAPPTSLTGTYLMSEVEHDGSTTMIDPAYSTQLVFEENGGYTRTSKKAGIVDHSDSGQYRVDGGDQLVLSTVMSDRKAKIPPIEKRHEFSLSADAEELRLTSGSGRVAVFRKVADKSTR